MFGDLLVGIALRFTSNGVMTMDRLNAATKAANIQLARQQGLIDANTAALQRNALAVERISTKWREMRAMAAGAFAIGGGILIGASINEAAKLQQNMMSVMAATGANRGQMGALQRMVVAVSGKTAQSATTIASEMAAVSAAGLNRPGRLMAAFPQLARAADVLMLSPKHLDPTESATQLSKLSHLFGIYQGPQFHNMVDAAVRLMYTQPETLNKLINQGKYFVPMALRAGVSMDEIFNQAMTLGQTGLLTGRGGTSLARYMQYMLGSPTITQFRSKQQLEGMKELGMYDSHGRNRFIDAQGHLELAKSLEWLSYLGKHMKGSDFVTALQKAFLQQGFYYASTVTLPNVMAQRSQNISAFGRIASPGQAVEHLWDLYVNQTLIGAWRKFWTNLVNIGINVFFPTLPMFTKFFNTMADTLGRWNDFLALHPKLGFDIALAAMAAVSAAAVYATINLWNLNRSILALGAVAEGKSMAGTVAGGRGWLQRLLFGSPFQPLARDERGRFVAGTAREARSGLFTPIVRAFEYIFGIGGLYWTGFKNFLLGTPQIVERDALGRFAGGAMARPGLFTPLLRFMTPLLELFGEALPAFAAVGMRFIPILGWILAVVGAINLLFNVMKNAPAFEVMIRNWWTKNAFGIGVAVGYIGTMIFSTITNMLKAVAAMVGAQASTFVQNMWEVMFNPAALQAQMDAASNAALKKLGQYGKYGTFSSGFATGMHEYQSGTPMGGVQVHVGQVNLQLPKGMDQVEAGKLWNIIAHPASSRVGGTGIGHPQLNTMFLYPH